LQNGIFEISREFAPLTCERFLPIESRNATPARAQNVPLPPGSALIQKHLAERSLSRSPSALFNDFSNYFGLTLLFFYSTAMVMIRRGLAVAKNHECRHPHFTNPFAFWGERSLQFGPNSESGFPSATPICTPAGLDASQTKCQSWLPLCVSLALLRGATGRVLPT
jgi:hypothetical protein